MPHRTALRVCLTATPDARRWQLNWFHFSRPKSRRQLSGSWVSTWLACLPDRLFASCELVQLSAAKQLATIPLTPTYAAGLMRYALSTKLWKAKKKKRNKKQKKSASCRPVDGQQQHQQLATMRLPHNKVIYDYLMQKFVAAAAAAACRFIAQNLHFPSVVVLYFPCNCWRHSNSSRPSPLAVNELLPQSTDHNGCFCLLSRLSLNFELGPPGSGLLAFFYGIVSSANNECRPTARSLCARALVLVHAAHT